mmetsp:Transcript_12407/g.41153  ORF Transcript_12407/g.41153 Transcript_12407/m.41153 type:complete len:374 (-) Transcript_12407:20-1141(-)
MDAVQVVHDRHQSEERAAEAELYVLPPLTAREVLHLDKAAAAALTLLEPHDPNRPELLVEVHVTAVPLEALGDVEAGQRVRLDDVAAFGPLEAVRAEAVQAHPREGLVRGAVRPLVGKGRVRVAEHRHRKVDRALALAEANRVAVPAQVASRRERGVWHPAHQRKRRLDHRRAEALPHAEPQRAQVDVLGVGQQRQRDDPAARGWDGVVHVALVEHAAGLQLVPLAQQHARARAARVHRLEARLRPERALKVEVLDGKDRDLLGPVVQRHEVGDVQVRKAESGQREEAGRRQQRYGDEVEDEAAQRAQRQGPADEGPLAEEARGRRSSARAPTARLRGGLCPALLAAPLFGCDVLCAWTWDGRDLYDHSAVFG